MKPKKASKRPGKRVGKVRSLAVTEAAFQLTSDEIHEALDDAIDKIDKIESGKMNPESARAILDKIKIVKALLHNAERELEYWLQSGR
jgi:GTP-sensing pleiotropic transcriptional regulator CodY